MKDRLFAAAVLAGVIGALLLATPVSGGTRGTFYANDRASLYEVDHRRRTSKKIMALPDRTTDIARSPGGELLACTEVELLRLRPEIGRWESIGRFRATDAMNALAFDSEGRLFGAGWDGGIYEIDPRTGRARRIGSFPAGWESAGDVIVMQEEQLLFTAHSPDRDSDSLVWFTPRSGKARLGADLGIDRVYGLARRGGNVVAFTELGEVLSIDARTGTTRYLWSLPVEFWGVEEEL